MQIWDKVDEPFKPDGLRLKMSTKTFIILGFGIIYFIPKENVDHDPLLTRILRRSLGVFLYMAMFYVVLFIAGKYFEWNINSLLLTAVTTVFLAIFFLYLEKNKRDLDILLYDSPTKALKFKAAKKITQLLKWYPLVLFSGFFSIVIMAIISSIFQWNRITVFTLLFVLIVNTISHVYFRISRPYLRYIFYSDGLYKSNKNLIELDVLKYFEGGNICPF